MILKLIAYQDEFEEDQDNPQVETRVDEVELSAIFELIQEFLEAAQVELPEESHVGLVWKVDA